jgi:D-glycero-D-manno-heptose 1,7-bisphosphate phosphatase
MMKNAIFLDKDGTLIQDVPYNVDPGRIVLVSDAGETLSRLQKAGYKLIVVSNQAGIARGYFEEKALEDVKVRLQELLQWWHVHLDGFYYCPHLPSGTVATYAQECNCRKPLPGMLVQAAQEHNISLEDAWMIGDILHDVEAGNRAGCRTILINNGNETEWIPGDFRTPTFTVRSLAEAADIILAMSVRHASQQAIHSSTHP